MPVQLSYPGVYLEEVKSGARTVSGASTSITAFIGAAKRGPVNDPVRVQSYGEFERIFGGLWQKSTMSYAARHYFLNGGGDAIINRIHNGATAAKMILDAGGNELPLEAANPGAWGNKLKARVSIDVSPDIAASFDLTENDLFNLAVYDGNSGVVEEFRNVTVKESPRRIDKVLEGYSKLVRVSDAFAPGGSIPAPNEDPESGKTVWDSTNNASTEVSTTGADGDDLTTAEYTESEAAKTGIYAFDKVDIFNMMCIPPISNAKDVLYLNEGGDAGKASGVLTKAKVYCKKRRAMLIMDPPTKWADAAKVVEAMQGSHLGAPEENAAVFFPRLLMPDPLKENRTAEFAPCGAIAGVFARTDTERGIWKAPAGVGATLKGVLGLSVKLTDGEHGQLNPFGVNCLRSFPVIGNVIYGSRTCKGADSLASEFKYVPVRRLTLYIEESLYRGSQFAVFEPNDEPLWADIRFAVTSFMQDLYRKGAFQGSSPSEAYFVKCDSETTIQDDIDRGIVNIMVGFAPLKPAEFVILKIQQMAGQGA